MDVPPTEASRGGRIGALAPRLRAAVLAAGGVALAGWLFGNLTRHGCLYPPSEVTSPEPGTPRAGFCSAVDGGAPWTAMLIFPAGVAAVCGLLSPRRRAVVLVACVLCVALFAFALLANSLDYAASP